MAQDTYTLLAKYTVGATGAASIDFTNIPQTGYTDLLIRLSGRCSRAADQSNLVISFNGSTSSFTGRYLEGLNTTVATATFARFIGAVPAANVTANTFGSFDVYIPNYTSSNYKSFSADAVQEGNTTNAYLELNAGLWSNTAAITSISITSNSSDNFVQYSDFYLYGISNVNTTPTLFPRAIGGDIITNDGTYWIHTFLSSGVFTPQIALSCDYLVVAGGGSGGGEPSSYGAAGGGGAGGLRSTVTATGGGGSLESKLSTTANAAYTVTIGAGGAGSRNQGSNGSNSVFGSITSTGGGGGGWSQTGTSQVNGLTGGSGGGGGGGNTGANGGTGGSGTSNQGYAGGTGSLQNNGSSGGGGGGAGAVGTTVTTNAGGAGGTGVAVAISGSSTYYAGGGGGASESNPASQGAGGNGGGGAGSQYTGVAGTSNTGGGGGGAYQDSSGTGGNGGSGIVIIRYAMA